eukprot:TRINITY_DN22413_c0_g1_i1.p1 TRINITY_DN22413_c0_g1~~TRINITY_DN22413_c0_g1_i1.p1  ORF type:complete len:597 (+),score=152.26 TRINITY_DN22413_c0_g1_i1:89-1879(+)
MLAVLLISSLTTVASFKFNYSQEALADWVDWLTLPGSVSNLTASSSPSFESFAGYITLNETSGKKFFYWFFESQQQQSIGDNDPLIVWTNGGPGCSGLIGLFEEHGPFVLDNSLNLIPNPYSWNTIANVLYVEFLAGVGFSTSTDEQDFSSNDAQSAQDMYAFLQGFFAKFPGLRALDLHLASESYGGHFLPFAAMEILQRNSEGVSPSLSSTNDMAINFRGFLVGNPYVDEMTNDIAMFKKMYTDGLLSYNLYKPWEEICGTVALRSFFWTECLLKEHDMYLRFGSHIHPYGINFPGCSSGFNISDTYAQRTWLYSYIAKQALDASVQFEPCSFTASYLSSVSVRSSLHADADVTWSSCSQRLRYDYQDTMADVRKLYKQVAEFEPAGSRRILVYSGDGDAICPTDGTEEWIFNLGYNALTNWDEWLLEDQTAGFITKFNRNITMVTVRDAGHEVASYQPTRALDMVKAYLNGSLFNLEFVQQIKVTSEPNTRPEFGGWTVDPPSILQNSTKSARSGKNALNEKVISGLFIGVLLLVVVVITLCLYALEIRRKASSTRRLSADLKHAFLPRQEIVGKPIDLGKWQPAVLEDVSLE